MTKTYFIHAWCSRPFISWLEIEAATPEEALAQARRQDAELLDAAEECNSGYPWDTFAVFGESGQQLLQVLDDEARLREAAPAMLDALLAIRAALQRYPQWQRRMAWHLLDLADAAIAQANGGAL